MKLIVNGKPIEPTANFELKAIDDYHVSLLVNGEEFMEFVQSVNEGEEGKIYVRVRISHPLAKTKEHLVYASTQ